MALPTKIETFIRRERLWALGTTMEKATLAGGCFWCLEATFEMLKGVEKSVSGYAGGHVKNPDYEAVCTGRTAS